MKLEEQSNAPHYVRDTFMKHFELWCIQWMPSHLHVLCGWQGIGKERAMVFLCFDCGFITIIWSVYHIHQMNFSPELNNHCCVSVYVCTSFFLKQLKVKQVSHTKILQSEPQAEVSMLIHPPAKPWMDYQSCRCGRAGFSYQSCLW